MCPTSGKSSRARAHSVHMCMLVKFTPVVASKQLSVRLGHIRISAHLRLATSSLIHLCALRAQGPCCAQSGAECGSVTAIGAALSKYFPQSDGKLDRSIRR